jgi:hypothetical protein
MTSKKLMSNCENKGVIHLDGTYKLLKNNFPLVIISDKQGQFHPIAFMITSHECQADFSVLYKDLIKLAKQLGLEFEPEYIMQDSAPASLNAAKELFDCPILMCYFHVTHNFRKHKNLIEDDKWEEFYADIRTLHYSHNEQVYKKILSYLNENI